jgi:hypothetical protein
VDHYEKKLEDIEENVRLEQSEVSLAGEVCAKLLSCHLVEILSFVRFYVFLVGILSINSSIHAYWCCFLFLFYIYCV